MEFQTRQAGTSAATLLIHFLCDHSSANVISKMLLFFKKNKTLQNKTKTNVFSLMVVRSLTMWCTPTVQPSDALILFHHYRLARENVLETTSSPSYYIKGCCLRTAPPHSNTCSFLEHCLPYRAAFIASFTVHRRTLHLIPSTGTSCSEFFTVTPGYCLLLSGLLQTPVTELS